jgi:hypothetical protein
MRMMCLMWLPLWFRKALTLAAKCATACEQVRGILTSTVVSIPVGGLWASMDDDPLGLPLACVWMSFRHTGREFFFPNQYIHCGILGSSDWLFITTSCQLFINTHMGIPIGAHVWLLNVLHHQEASWRSFESDSDRYFSPICFHLVRVSQLLIT